MKKFAEYDRRKFLGLCAGAAATGMLTRAPMARADYAVGPPQDSPSTPIKVIIDTDPGVDDAYALLLAMRSPELQIMAITPVAGNVPLHLTLPNALRMVEIAGRQDIPVAGGASQPLVRDLITAESAHGKNGLGGVVFPEPTIQPVKDHAADLICKIVRQNPNQVTLIGIGPLTNIALALRQDSGIIPLVRRIVLMGGSLSGGNITPAAEFNFYVDPEAASIVFNSGIPITMVGLDVTRKVQLKESHVRQLEAAGNRVSDAAAKIAQATIDMYRRQGYAGGPHMHDPLAVSALIRPEILGFEDYQIDIETSGEITSGESVGWKKGPVIFAAPLQTENGNPYAHRTAIKENAQVATQVNPDKFFNLLISRLARG